ANPMGASCARVCPTDQLCEGACVYAQDETPIRIGDLQRYAIDWLMRHDDVRLFEPGPSSGKRVAVIGGGPAGLSAARELARAGHAVTIFDRHEELGGLNTFGIVPFRLPLDVALWEAQQVVDLGVNVRTGVEVGIDLAPADLLEKHDAIVLAFGMGAVPRLRIPGEELPGVWDALDFIERAKLGRELGTLGSSVAVIGAGNTAIDAATCSRRLGVERVTMYYRRGPEEMTAYGFEVDFAKAEGVEFRFHCVPTRIIARDGRAGGIEFVRAKPGPRSAELEIVRNSTFTVEADTVVCAVGQTRLLALLEAFGVAHDGSVAKVDDSFRSSNPKVFVAGDLVFRSGTTDAMVVVAAQQGKLAAHAVDAQLRSTVADIPEEASV
ncbi:MAG: FAD-dependent oxidoreductase, partial [Candidatus Eremiobacteraeota bacterium]|nr:FAD-dependent oxidoreductase [Candidatus Eremiobacteraeota bacterium]